MAGEATWRLLRLPSPGASRRPLPTSPLGSQSTVGIKLVWLLRRWAEGHNGICSLGHIFLTMEVRNR